MDRGGGLQAPGTSLPAQAEFIFFFCEVCLVRLPSVFVVSLLSVLGRSVVSPMNSFPLVLHLVKCFFCIFVEGQIFV